MQQVPLNIIHWGCNERNISCQIENCLGKSCVIYVSLTLFGELNLN